MTTPAGWYDDGTTPEVERYWDGEGWTEQTRPLPLPPTVATVDVQPKRQSFKEAMAENKTKSQERQAHSKAEAEAKAAAKQEAKAEQRLEQAHEQYSGGGARPDIAEAAARMTWRQGGKRELKKLSEHVLADEKVRYIAQGTFNDKQGIVVLSDQRLIFIFHGLATAIVEDFPLRSITSVASKQGLVMGTLIVHVAGAASHISNVTKADLQFLIDDLRGTVAAGQQPQVIVQQAAAAPVDIAEQLTKLAALRDQGILTDEEFAAQKGKLLS